MSREASTDSEGSAAGAAGPTAGRDAAGEEASAPTATGAPARPAPGELEEALDTLRAIAAEARELAAGIAAAAEAGEEAPAPHLESLRGLAERFDRTARLAARERRRREIRRLSAVISAHESTLALAGLSSDTREALRAQLVASRARRSRLRSQDATDFDGLLSAEEVEALEGLVERARDEARERAVAAAWLDVAYDMADLALTVAGRLAL